MAAEPAVLARGRPRDDDVIADLDVVDFGTHRFDDACTLVPEYAGRTGGQRTGRLRQIRVAHPTRGDPHPDLSRGDVGEVDVGDLEWLPDLAQDGGAFGHGLNSSPGVWVTFYQRSNTLEHR